MTAQSTFCLFPFVDTGIITPEKWLILSWENGLNSNNMVIQDARVMAQLFQTELRQLEHNEQLLAELLGRIGHDFFICECKDGDSVDNACSELQALD